jgi:TonB family protein
VSVQALSRALAVGLLLIGGWAAINAPLSWGQDEISRKAKSRVAPVYPEVAKKMSISGVVRIQVTVAANGSIKDARLVGGHPMLANAALDAVRKWRYEAAPAESTGIVVFRFDPTQ